MYHEFAANVEHTSYEAAKKMIQDLYPKCSSDEAWIKDNMVLYEQCTAEISNSNPRIASTLPKIKRYGYTNNLNMSIQAQISQLMEDVVLHPYTNDGLEVAIAFIKDKSSKSSFVECSEANGCLEITRQIVVQLKMIEWRIFSIGQSTAGMFLAYHFSKLGPYFGDIEGRNPNSCHLYNNAIVCLSVTHLQLLHFSMDFKTNHIYGLPMA